MCDKLLGGGHEHPPSGDLQLEERVEVAVVVVREDSGAPLRRSRLLGLDRESDEVLEVELVLLPVRRVDAEFEPEQLLCAPFGVEVGEGRGGARDAAP